MRIFRGYKFLPVLIILLIVGIAAGVAAPKEKETAQRRKARHYFLSAIRAEAENKNDESHELFRKAYETDSTYAEAALEYGVRRMIVPSGGEIYPQGTEDGKRMARRFVDTYPGDFFPGYVYVRNMENVEELEEAIRAAEQIRKYNPSNSDILQVLNGLYLDTGQIGEAMDVWDEYGRIEGEDLDYFVRKAGMKVAVGDTLGTLEVGRQMLEKNPGNPAAVAFMARLHSYFENPDSALYYFQKAENMSPAGSGGVVKMQIADYYLTRGDSINYDAKTYEALMADDLDFEIKNGLLAHYLQNLINDDGDRARGDRLFSVLLDQYPHEPELLSLAARYSASKRDFKKALEEIDYAIDLNRTESKYWEQALTYCLLLEDYDRGYKYYKTAAKQLPMLSMPAYAIAGSMAMMDNKADLALEIYGAELSNYFPGQEIGKPINMEALRTTLTSEGVDQLADLYQQIGDAYYKAGDSEQAYQYFENSLMLNPNVPLTLNNYAYFLVKDGETIPEDILAKADEMSKRAVVLAPDVPTYLDTRAWVLFRKGEYKEAKEVQKSAIELLGEHATPEEQTELYEHLGDILFMNHEPAEALESWKKALKGNPDSELLQRKVKHKTFFYK